MEAYIGIDLGKESVAAFCGFGETTAHRQTLRFKTSHSEFSRLLKWVTERGVTKGTFVMEASGPYWAPLYAWLIENGQEVYLANPSAPRHFAKSRLKRTKNDRVDARTIAEFAAREKLSGESGRLNAYELQLACRAIRSHIENAAAAKNRIIQLLDVLFPELATVFHDVTCMSSLAFLKKYPTPKAVLDAGEKKISEIKVSKRSLGPSKAQEVYEAARSSVGLKLGPELHAIVLQNQIDVLQQQNRAISRLEDWIAKNASSEALKLLMSHPGCGIRTAAVVMSEVVDPARFPSADKIVAYAGVFPREIQSGKLAKTAKSYRMAKTGNRALRHALYLIALNAVGRDTDLKVYYLRKQKQGKKPMVALGHCMRKVLVTLWAIWRKKKPYEQRIVAEAARG